jgi:hypothetical protein
MSQFPTSPAGIVALDSRHLQNDRGEVARWRHADVLPYVEVSLRAAGQHGGYPEQIAHVNVRTGPATCGLDGVTDPRELRQVAWLLLDAARWLERNAHARPAEPDPQTSIYDHLETT